MDHDPNYNSMDHATKMSFPGTNILGQAPLPNLLQQRLQDLQPALCQPYFSTTDWFRDKCQLSLQETSSVPDLRPLGPLGTRLGNWPLRQFPPPQRRSGRRPAELLPCFRGVVGRVNISQFKPQNPGLIGLMVKIELHAFMQDPNFSHQHQKLEAQG